MELDKKKAMEGLGIPEDMYNELLRDFVAQAETVLLELQVAVEAGNFPQIANRGHFIRGSAGMLRLHELHLIAGSIEAGGKEGKELEKVKTYVESFKRVFEELKKII